MTKFFEYFLDLYQNIHDKSIKNMQGYSEEEIYKIELFFDIKFPQFYREFLSTMGKTPDLFVDDFIYDPWKIYQFINDNHIQREKNQWIILVDQIVYPDDSYYIDLNSDPFNPNVQLMEGKLEKYTFSEFLIEHFFNLNSISSELLKYLRSISNQNK